MRLYKCDWSSANYWIAADNAAQAMVVALNAWTAEGCSGDDIDHVSFDDVTSSDKSKLAFPEDDKDCGRTFADIARDTAEPKLIGCSDY